MADKNQEQLGGLTPVGKAVSELIDRAKVEYFEKRGMVVAGSDPGLNDAILESMRDAFGKGFFDGIVFVMNDPRAEIMRNRIRCQQFTTVN